MAILEFGMSNVFPAETKLPNGIVVWVGPKQGQHGPRIKVSNVRNKARFGATDSFSMSVCDTPKVVAGTPKHFSGEELALLTAWIVLNESVLLKYWNHADSYPTIQMLHDLTPLE